MKAPAVLGSGAPGFVCGLADKASDPTGASVTLGIKTHAYPESYRKHPAGAVRRRDRETPSSVGHHLTSRRGHIALLLLRPEP